MFAQFTQGTGRGRGPPAPCRLLGQHFDRAVHADGEHLVHIRDVGIGGAVLDVGTKTADPRLDQHAVFGVRADGTRQVQQLQPPLQIHAFGRPALWQAGARGFRDFGRRLAFLNIGTKAPGLQVDRHAIGIKAQHTFRTALFVAGNGAGVATFGIVAAADEGPARPRGLQMQPPRPAGGARPGVRSVFAQGIKVRRKEFINPVKHFTNPQIGGFGDGGREITPEPVQHLFVIPLARGHVIQLRFQIGGEIVFHIFAEIVRQERRHQPPLVFGDQAVLVLADVFAVHDRGQDGRIG